MESLINKFILLTERSVMDFEVFWLIKLRNFASENRNK